MPTFLLTFHPHPLEQSLLPTFLVLLFKSKLFLESTEYYYAIEKPDTSGAHLHLFFTTSQFQGVHYVEKHLKTKYWSPFWTSLKIKETDSTHALNILLVGKNKTRNDREYYLGYVQKDISGNIPPQYPLSTNIDTLQCLSSYEYYIEHKRLQIKTDKVDQKVLKLTNVVPEICDFLKKEDISLDKHIWDRLAQKWIFTFGISDNQKCSIYHQLELAMGIIPIFFDKVKSEPKYKPPPGPLSTGFDGPTKTDLETGEVTYITM